MRQTHGEATAAGMRGELSDLRKHLVALCRNGVPSYAWLAEQTGASVGTIAGAVFALRQAGLVPFARKV